LTQVVCRLIAAIAGQAPAKGLAIGGSGLVRIFQGGIRASLVPLFAELSWANIFPVDPGTRQVVCDGIRPLVDKDGLLRALTEVVRKVI
jgi:hypothetical protein